MSPRTRVAVIFGGRSTEHQISCVSAGCVLAALDPERYDVVAIGISPDGRWLLVDGDPLELARRERELPQVGSTGVSVMLPADPTRTELVVLSAGEGTTALQGVDVVFPVLHGPYGEDGTIQGLLEMAGVPYVGSGVFASAAAMDKAHMKSLLAAAGLPMGAYSVISDRDWRLRRSESLAGASALGSPIFVKPARGGSSIGITKVVDLAQLESAIEAARAFDDKVIVEAAVPGREIECGVLDGDQPAASVPAEIRVLGGHEFYDFEAKYLDDATELDVPAHLDEATVHRVQELAVAAFLALDCAGLARVDFFVTPAGEVLVNEVNTMPGFTPASMFPQMWAASGVDYPALVDRLITSALSRANRTL